jgi:alpha-galactosidase
MRQRAVPRAPDWALATPGKTPALGRNQLLAGSCKPPCATTLWKTYRASIDEAGFSYVKWDMNRHISDAYSPLHAKSGRVLPHDTS